jgi:hypothetical protein
MARLVFHAAVKLLAVAICIAGGVAGIFAAGGLCAAVWGGSILDTALGQTPDRSHPAFWLLLLVGALALVVGFCGTFFVLVVPLLHLTGGRLGVGKRPDSLTDWLEKYARWLDGIVSRERGTASIKRIAEQDGKGM